MSENNTNQMTTRAKLEKLKIDFIFQDIVRENQDLEEKIAKLDLLLKV